MRKRRAGSRESRVSTASSAPPRSTVIVASIYDIAAEAIYICGRGTVDIHVTQSTQSTEVYLTVCPAPPPATLAPRPGDDGFCSSPLGLGTRPLYEFLAGTPSDDIGRSLSLSLESLERPGVVSNHCNVSFQHDKIISYSRKAEVRIGGHRASSRAGFAKLFSPLSQLRSGILTPVASYIHSPLPLLPLF